MNAGSRAAKVARVCQESLCKGITEPIPAVAKSKWHGETERPRAGATRGSEVMARVKTQMGVGSRATPRHLDSFMEEHLEWLLIRQLLARTLPTSAALVHAPTSSAGPAGRGPPASDGSDTARCSESYPSSSLYSTTARATASRSTFPHATARELSRRCARSFGWLVRPLTHSSQPGFRSRPATGGGNAFRAPFSLRRSEVGARGGTLPDLATAGRLARPRDAGNVLLNRRAAQGTRCNSSCTTWTEEHATLTIRQGKGKKDRIDSDRRASITWVERSIHEARPQLASGTGRRHAVSDAVWENRPIPTQ